MLSPAGQYISPLASQGSLRRSHVMMWSGAAVCVLLLMGMIVGAPVLLARGYTALALVIYKAFSPLCHQISARSFHVEGHAFAVCARCTGIYAGFAAGVIFYPFFRSLKRTDTPARRWLLLATVPVTIDWALGFLGIWENNHLSRLLTGGLLGVVAAFYIVPGLMDVLHVDWRRFFANSSAETTQTPSAIMPVARERVGATDYGSPSSRI